MGAAHRVQSMSLRASQSPRFGSRCFVTQDSRPSTPTTINETVAIPSVRVSVFRRGLGVPVQTLVSPDAPGRNPLGSGLGVSSFSQMITEDHSDRPLFGRNPLGSGLGVSSQFQDFRQTRSFFSSPVAIPSVRVSVFRRVACVRGLGSCKRTSQSPRFGSRCFVLRIRGLRVPPAQGSVAIPSVRVSVFRPAVLKVSCPRAGWRVAIPSVRVSVFRRRVALNGSAPACLSARSQSPRFGSRCFVLPCLLGVQLLRLLAPSQSPRFGSRCFVICYLSPVACT